MRVQSRCNYFGECFSIPGWLNPGMGKPGTWRANRIPTMAKFKPPRWDYWTQSFNETLAVSRFWRSWYEPAPRPHIWGSWWLVGNAADRLWSQRGLDLQDSFGHCLLGSLVHIGETLWHSAPTDWKPRFWLHFNSMCSNDASIQAHQCRHVLHQCRALVTGA